MKRTFRAFNAEIIRKEFFTLSEPDGRDLRRAMERYQKDKGIGYEVRNYGDGLMMLKPTGGAAGRCLFFFASTVNEKQTCTVAPVYKKESTEVPAKVMTTARRRMEESK